MNLLQHCSCIVPKCQTLNCCKIVMKLRNVGHRFPMLPLFQDTPIPGTYHVRDFVEEADLNPVKKTYGFKGVGRKTQTLGVRKGDLLLPGAYEYTDSTQEVLMHQASYSFKNCPRPDIFTLGIRDKHINTSPCDYNVTARPVEKIPCKHVMFRSTVQRISFLPKDGPAPCHYNPQTKPAKAITSCFKSTLPRLHGVHSVSLIYISCVFLHAVITNLRLRILH
ncbi:protein STPG4 isoform X1 [Haplochromis burtoni]|uniref:protein STPG4 isoform X1 n=1 Tax=Haplochromis burtoni TaxID=8153 RepID=UPI001C2CE961|nr:protein STPG4 isoform X1 [Haplochromis burtoni]